jgi:Tat protein secretion system quality control protein TatD with DNase activity
VGLLHWFSDIEKQTAVSDLSKSNSGFVYYATGIHPDNIDRTNKKSHDEWLEKVEELGKKAECLALLTGLNLAREMGTHFSQESLLKSTVQIAEKLQLPVILHTSDLKSLERSLELITAEGEETNGDDEEGNGYSVPVIVHDILTCSGADLAMRDALIKASNVYFIVSGAGLADADANVREKTREFVKGLPMDRILFCSDSPWRTPQNLPDPYLRTLRNEPANIPFVAEGISEALGVDKMELSKLVRETTMRLFAMEHVTADTISTAKAINSNFSVEDVAKSVATKLSVSKTATSESSSALSEGNETGSASSSSTKKDTSSATVTATTNENSEYRCVKCRSMLFKPSDITTHSLGATKTVFKVGEEGLCASFIFVPAHDGREIHKRLGVSIRGGNVECTTCGAKLGKYSPGEAVCPCGALVTGPVTKINAAKTDFCDATLDAKELAERSKIENQDAFLQAELENMEMEARLQSQGGRVKKVKKHKSENKGNFSSFRNKSFVPNASKSGKGEGNNKESGATAKDNSKKGGKQQDDSSEDDENEDDEMAEGSGDEEDENEEEDS